jgi:Reverse transcriptase (RNA-dependent DNA polymerase)
MSGSPTMNGVTKRRNRTLMEIVRSMISHTSLSLNLWGESLKSFVFMILYVYDILFFSNDKNMMCETKKKNFKHFDIKDLGEASYVLGLKIHRDLNKGILGLSQQVYIDKILKRYGIKNYKSENTPVAKGDKFSLDQCPKIELEKSEMQQITYASLIGSLIYAQVCTRPDIVYIIGMVGRYLSNPDMNHWKATKMILRYLQRTKNHILTNRRSDKLEVIGYTDSEFAGYVDSLKSTSGYILCWLEKLFLEGVQSKP